MSKRGDKQPDRFINTFSIINLILSIIILLFILFNSVNLNTVCCSDKKGCSIVSSVETCNARSVMSYFGDDISTENDADLKYIQYTFGNDNSVISWFVTLGLLFSINLGYFIGLILKKKYNLPLATAAIGILTLFSAQGFSNTFSSIPELIFQSILSLIPPALLLFFSILSFKQNRKNFK